MRRVKDQDGKQGRLPGNLTMLYPGSDAVCRKRPELWENQSWMLHHDNAQARAALLVCSYLVKHHIPVVPHPPYSPDLAPADFLLFPELKNTLKGRCFQTIEEIKDNAMRNLRTVPQNVFQEAFRKWKTRWEWAVASRGGYFEGYGAYNVIQ